MTVLAAGICALYGAFAYWKYTDLKTTLSVNQRKSAAAQPPPNWGKGLSPEKKEVLSLARPCHTRNCRRPPSPTRRAARGFRAERVPSAMPLLSSLKQRARHLKSETLVLWFAARHPGTPWYAKLLVAGIVAYALSPIDLIPDFVPVLGYVDDLILIPLGIVLAIRMIPGPILEECRARAQERMASARPVSRVAAFVIVAVWIAAAALCALWAYRTWFSS